MNRKYMTNGALLVGPVIEARKVTGLQRRKISSPGLGSGQNSAHATSEGGQNA